jgi:hypothetical protein
MAPLLTGVRRAAGAVMLMFSQPFGIGSSRPQLVVHEGQTERLVPP